MRSSGWQVVLIYSLGGFIIICGLTLIAYDWAAKYSRARRRNRRLYEHNNRYSLKDIK
jgi:hypothetical protein